MSNKVYLERVSSTAKAPTKGSTHAAYFDLYADLESRTVTKRTEVNEEVKVHTILEGDYITLQPKERVLIPTGWKMQCPEDMSIDFVPRSGIAWKEGVSVINTPGVIDCDYPNECYVALVNREHGLHWFVTMDSHLMKLKPLKLTTIGSMQYLLNGYKINCRRHPMMDM